MEHKRFLHEEFSDKQFLVEDPSEMETLKPHIYLYGT